MYNRIFKILENRLKEHELIEKYLDSYIKDLNSANEFLKETINILEEKLHVAQSQLKQDLND